MATVSVIVPVYNGEKYIRETLDSVFAQTLADFEIIVVNDGSTDATVSVLETCHDPRVRIINKSNGGTASAINLGITESNGQYIQILGADDIILPGKLAHQIQLMEADSTIDLVYSSFRYFYDDYCETKAPNWLKPISDDPYRDLMAGSIFPAHAALFRRRCIQQVGLFREDLVSAEDWDFWLRLARAGCRFLYHDNLYALYRLHTTNKIKRRARWRRAHVEVMENLRREAQDALELSRINWPYYASSNYVQWALALLLEDDTAQAKEALTTAYVYSPSLGSSPDILSQMITQYALEYDSQGEQQDPAGWGDYLKRLQDILPSTFPARDIMQSANALYWRAKAHQAHIAHAGSEVRRCLGNAFRYDSRKQIDRGMLSIFLQSFIGHEHWRHLKRIAALSLHSGAAARRKLV